VTREILIAATAVDQFPAFEDDGFSKRSGLTSPADFTATVFRDAVVVALPVTIAEIGSTGEYKTEFTPNIVGFYELQVLVDFNKEIRFRNYTAVPELTNPVVIETRDKVFEIATTTGQVDEQLATALGLLHLNTLIDNQTYDGNNQLLTARVRVFVDATAAAAATVGGSEVGTQEYSVEATYAGIGQNNKYLLKKVL